MRTCRFFFFFIELLRNEVFVFLIYGNINRIEYSIFHFFFYWEISRKFMIEKDTKNLENKFLFIIIIFILSI